MTLANVREKIAFDIAEWKMMIHVPFPKFWDEGFVVVNFMSTLYDGAEFLAKLPVGEKGPCHKTKNKS